MVEGEFQASVGSIADQKIRSVAPGVGPVMYEVELVLDANGAATAEHPFVAGSAMRYWVKKGDGVRANPVLTVTAHRGILAPESTVLVSKYTVSSDVVSAGLDSSGAYGGALTIAITSSAVNAGKKIKVGFLFILPVSVVAAVVAG